MSRIVSTAAVAAILFSFAAGAMAQQPNFDRTWNDRFSTNDRYSTDRATTYQSRDTTYRGRSAAPRTTADREPNMRRANMPRGQFASEAEARSACRGDTVVWANTKSHVYHFPGTPTFGRTK